MWRHQLSGVTVHVRPEGCARWQRGRARWVDDGLAFRPRSGRRHERLFRVAGGSERAPTSEERWWIHRHGGDMVLGTLRLHGGGSLDVVTRRSDGPVVFGGCRRAAWETGCAAAGTRAVTAVKWSPG